MNSDQPDLDGATLLAPEIAALADDVPQLVLSDENLGLLRQFSRFDIPSP